jgi:predicted dehydrogenase
MTDRRTFLLRTAGSLAGIALIPDVVAAMPARLRAPRRVGIIGAGRQGRAIVAELQKLPDVTVPVLCDTSAARLKTSLERAPGAEGASDYRVVLSRADLDAVVIATPTHLHRPIALDAIQAGKHVYLEAPIAHTVDDARAIAAAAAGAKPVLYAGFQGRANPLYQRAFSFIGSDSLRSAVSLYAQSNRKTSWRFPAAEPGSEQAVNWRLDPAVSLGLAGELGAQQFDVALRYLGGKLPVRISGHGALRLHTDGRKVPDTAFATLFWEDGVAMQWQATLANSYGGQYEVLHAENAAIKTAWSHAWFFKEADSPTQGWEVYATRQQIGNDEGIVLLADATKLAAQAERKRGEGLPYTPLYYALADFLACVDDGRRATVSLSDGARATALGILANQAITAGTTVTVPPDLGSL